MARQGRDTSEGVNGSSERGYMAHQEEHLDDQTGYMAHHEGLMAISCHEGYRARQVGHNGIGISGEVYTSSHTPPVRTTNLYV